MKKRWIVTGLLTALLAAGCSSTPERSDEENRKAADTNAALGRQYMDRGQYEIALEKLKRSVAYDKTYAPAHTLLGVLYETIGETELAEDEYRQAVRYDPDGGEVNNNLGAFLCASGRPGEADPYFNRAVEDPFYQTPEVAMSNAGSCAMSDGNLDKAESYLRQSLEYNDKLASALLPMAEVSLRKGSYLRARAFLQRYEAVGPMTEESLQLGLRIETALGDDKSAGEYREKLREFFPGALQAGIDASQGRQ